MLATPQGSGAGADADGAGEDLDVGMGTTQHGIAAWESAVESQRAGRGRRAAAHSRPAMLVALPLGWPTRSSSDAAELDRTSSISDVTDGDSLSPFASAVSSAKSSVDVAPVRLPHEFRRPPDHGSTCGGRDCCCCCCCCCCCYCCYC